MSYQSRRASARLRLEIELLEDRVTPTTLVVGPNINTSRLIANDQTEGTIVKNPSAPNQLFTSSVDYSRLGPPGGGVRGLHGARSSNGGATWTQSTVATGDGADSVPAAFGDPSAAWDEYGNIFLTYITKDAVQFGTTTAGSTTTTMKDSAKNWPANRWAGHQVFFTNPPPGGPSEGHISGNDATTLFIEPAFNAIPPAGLTYRIVKPGALVSVEVIYSTNGGATFQYLATLQGDYGDNPSIAVGPGSAPGTGSVWVTYVHTLATRTIIAKGATVTGLGAISGFGPAQYPFISGMTPPPGSMGAPDVAIGPVGKVAVAAQTQSTPARIWANLDADGLGPQDFSSPVLVVYSGAGWLNPIPAQPNRGINALPRLAWDRTHDKLYISYADTTPGLPDTDIFVRGSDDGGRTWWLSGILVHTPNGNSQFMADLAVDQTTGKLAVAWHDARQSPSNTGVKIYGTVSETFGVTFLPDVAIAAGLSVPQVPLPPPAPLPNDFDYGDYMGIAFHAGAFHPAWADNSNSTGDNIDGAAFRTDWYTARVDVVVGGGGGGMGGGDLFEGGGLGPAMAVSVPTDDKRRAERPSFTRHDRRNALWAFRYEKRRSLIDEVVTALGAPAFDLYPHKNGSRR